MTAARIPACYGDEARRRPPRHVHHGRRARERRVLRGRARPADGQEDRQPGRPDRLPPLLRRRARLGGRRHHVLRVPGRADAAAPATGWCISSRSASAPRSRSSSGSERVGGVDHGPVARLRGSGGAEARAGRRRLGRAAADRGRARHPGGAPPARLRRRARVRVAARAERASCWRRSASSPAGRCAATRAAASTATTRRPAQRRPAGARAPCTTSRGRRSRTSTRRGGSG